jgi:hypothetical protein
MSEQVTYEYYRDGYFGHVLKEEDFNKYLGEAVRCVSRLTFGRSEREEYSNEPKVKNAICAAAEAAFQCDSTYGDDIFSFGVKSESKDGHSVTFDGTTKDQAERIKAKSMERAVRTELFGTGLLFRGVYI